MRYRGIGQEQAQLDRLVEAVGNSGVSRTLYAPVDPTGKDIGPALFVGGGGGGTAAYFGCKAS